jgi:hypothetical protein
VAWSVAAFHTNGLAIMDDGTPSALSRLIPSCALSELLPVSCPRNRFSGHGTSFAVLDGRHSALFQVIMPLFESRLSWRSFAPVGIVGSRLPNEIRISRGLRNSPRLSACLSLLSLSLICISLSPEFLVTLVWLAARTSGAWILSPLLNDARIPPSVNIGDS